MNGQKIALGLIIFGLCLMCVTNTSIIGCSKTENVSNETDIGNAPRTPFFSRSDSNNYAAPTEWEPISENVQDQIKEFYSEQGFEIENIYRGEHGTYAVKVVLVADTGDDRSQLLMDGICILHENFPEQKYYEVQITGAMEADLNASWDTINAVIEDGCSLDSPQSRVSHYLNVLEGTELLGDIPESTDASGVNVATD